MGYAYWLVIGAVVLVAFAALAFFVWGLKKALKLLVNSLIGFFALWLTKMLIIPTLVINLWSVLLVAILGIVGYIGVIILHFVSVF